MNETESKRIALRAIEAVLDTVAHDANALTSTDRGEVNPGAALIELIRKLSNLAA